MGGTWGRRGAALGTAGVLALTVTGCSPPLDETFGGGDGIATTRAFWNGWHTPEAVAVQPDGKIVVYTDVQIIGTLMALVRFDPDGTIDPTFGDGGVALTDHPKTYGGCADLALAPDGGYLFVVDALDENGNNRSSVARYNPDGTPDEVFGDSGVALVPGGYACGLDVQPDGKIVTGGWTGEGAIAARFSAGGHPDLTFGGDGVGEAWPGPNVFRGVGTSAVDVQPDGGIVGVGSAVYEHTGSTFGSVQRHLPDGTLDPTFASNSGWTLIGWTPGGLDGVATRPDGRVVVFGNQRPVTDPDPRGFLVAQLTADGELDPTFGPTGNGVVEAVDGGTAQDMVLLDDGDVVLVGGTAPGGTHDGFLLARFTPEGDLDDGFGDHGVGTTDAFPTDEAALAVAVQPDGKLVVAGSVDDDDPAVVGTLIGVYRYEAGG